MNINDSETKTNTTKCSNDAPWTRSEYIETFRNTPEHTIAEYLAYSLSGLENQVIVSLKHLDLAACLTSALDKLKAEFFPLYLPPHRIILTASLSRADSCSGDTTGLTNVCQCYWNENICYDMHRRFHRNGIDWFASIFLVF